MGARPLLRRCRQNIHMQMRIAHVAKNNVLTGEFAVKRLAIKAQHFIVARNGNRKI